MHNELSLKADDWEKRETNKVNTQTNKQRVYGLTYPLPPKYLFLKIFILKCNWFKSVMSLPIMLVLTVSCDQKYVFSAVRSSCLDIFVKMCYEPQFTHHWVNFRLEHIVRHVIERRCKQVVISHGIPFLADRSFKYRLVLGVPVYRYTVSENYWTTSQSRIQGPLSCPCSWLIREK